MTIKTEKFVRKPFEIEAVQVTAQNINEVAAWCKGKVVLPDGTPGPHFIKVDVKNPLTERQTKAFVGDWVLFSGKGGYKVYTNKGFEISFEPSTPMLKSDQASKLKEELTQTLAQVEPTRPTFSEPLRVVKSMTVND